eukprot:8921979-Pyramimonas_sp.AAC.1
MPAGPAEGAQRTSGTLLQARSTTSSTSSQLTPTPGRQPSATPPLAWKSTEPTSQSTSTLAPPTQRLRTPTPGRRTAQVDGPPQQGARALPPADNGRARAPGSGKSAPYFQAAPLRQVPRCQPAPQSSCLGGVLTSPTPTAYTAHWFVSSWSGVQRSTVGGLTTRGSMRKEFLVIRLAKRHGPPAS